MAIYWLLFAFPALMALAYPVNQPRYGYGLGHGLAMMAFVLFYAVVGGLRYETGGDWLTYEAMFEEIRTDSFLYAVGRTDPLYGALDWFSAQLGLGLYFVNGTCCFLLVLGTSRAAQRMKEPWLAVLMAVPYLLIVVGMGYVRQGAAIGLILYALASLDRSRPARTLILLVMAAGFHSTAMFTFPFFGFAIARRNRLLTLVGIALAAALYQFVLAPRLNSFDAGYINTQYDSSGALTRVMMGVLPALFVLARWRRFVAEPRARIVWMLIGLANLAALVALALSPSSTAVDRVALYFSVIQLLAFGEFRDLANVSPKTVLLARLMLIAIAASVQVVWLVYAVNSQYWVPYQSVLQFL
jgi:EpsG family